MKKHLKVVLLAGIFSILLVYTEAQNKKVIKSPALKSTSSPEVKFIPREFGSPVSVSDVKDIKEIDPEYESVKDLIETNGVTLVYADSTFRPKDPLRRGDFMVSFNAALNAIKKTTDAGGLDSSSIINYGNNPSGATSVSEIRDAKESNVYYPAAQSLIERWKVDALFTKSKSLNAGATMTESEVYDILKTTLGYNSPGANPYAAAMSRAKFAMVLNNALNLKLSQVNAMVSARKDSMDDLATQQQMMLKQQEKQRNDSIAKETELSKIDAQKKQAEAWNKLSDSQKRKQLKSQNSK